MDVGQILGTTSEPIRRESEPYRDDSEEFASYLSESAPKNEVAPKSEDPAKKESVKTEAPVDEPVGNQSAAPEKTAKKESAPETEKTADSAPKSETASNEEALSTSKDGSDIAVAANAAPIPVTPPAAPKATAATSDRGNKPASSASPVATVAQNILNSIPANDEMPANVADEQTVASQMITAKKSELPGDNTKKTDVATTQSAVQPSTLNQPDNARTAKKATFMSATGNEKPAAPVASGTKPAPVPSEALETVRAEAAAKMSEKDILSTKIAEMLQDGKGKITLAASQQKQSFQSALASSTNLVTAAMANYSAATGHGALPFATNEGEGLITQALPAVSTGVQGLPSDTVNQTAPAVPTGSIQGVEATAANNASQAANAARASAHLPVAEQVSTHISAAIKEGHDRIKISLHPSELGRVEVKLDIGHDGRVLAVVSVDKQETLDMLQKDARALERALQDAGFDTGSNSLNFGLRQNGQDGQGDGTNFANFDLPMEEMNDETGAASLPPQSQSSGVTVDGALDIQV